MFAFMFYSQFSRSWIGACATLLIACGDSPSDRVEPPETLAGPTAAERLEQLAIARKDMSGEQLAHIYCQTCHAFPNPDSFDKATWIDEVFPLMGPRLGIYAHGNTTYRDFRKESPALAGRTDVFPDAPQLTGTEWQKLMDWYASAAPDQPLPQDEHEKISVGLKHFEVKFPPRTDKRPAMTTVVKIDPVTGNIYLGNAMTNNLITYDKHFKLVNTFEMKSPPIHLRFDPGNGPQERGLWLTEIGSLRPTNDPIGKLHYMYVRPDASIVEPHSTPIDALIRPVYSTFADLNDDQQLDIVISEFGWHVGALNWYQNLGGYRMQKHTLKAEPGAISSYAHDFDGNGHQDVIALMAQGNEGIFMFWNDGNGSFREQQLLKFPPTWGSSSFELADFNDDGFLDILYTGGDNGDGMKVLKKYLGIRIFLNDGKQQFSEAWFFPLNGAYKAAARDFDGDGDLDIAANSFFADYDNTPEEGFVYLENEGNLRFSPFTFEEVTLGRWMVMDVDDWDQDGDQDIVLGSFIHGPSKVSDAVKQVWVERGPVFVVLENTSRKN
jgi:hypothetical protein